MGGRGKPIGTIFAELDLDPSRYTKAQQQLLKDATRVTLDIEQNFRKMGIKSSAEFDLMRAKIQNSYEMIRSSAQATANDVLRAEQAKNAQLKALHEKQFGAQKSVIDGIRDHWIGATVAIAAAYTAMSGTIRAASAVAVAGARYETLGVVMNVVGKTAGYTANEMRKYSEALQESGISMTESRGSLARMVQANLDLAEATKLARIAQDAAVIGNINSSEAFQRLVYGIQSAQVEMLRTIGLNVNFENAYEKTAKATKRAKDSFSETEKATIRMNAVIEAGAKISGTYEAAMETAGKQLTSFPRYLEDFKVKMGQAFNPATSMLVEAATTVMKEFQKEVSKPEAQAALGELSRSMAKAAVEAGRNLPDALGKTIASLRLMLDVYNSMPGTVVGAAGAGLIGRMLFGAGPAGAIAASLYVINDALETFNLNVGRMPKKLNDLAENLGRIRDQITGKTDWRTGQPASGPFQGGGAGKTPSGAGAEFPDPDLAAAAARAAKKKAEEAAEAARLAAEKFAKDMEKITEQAYLKEMGLFEDLEKENAKYLENMAKEQEKFAEDLYLSEMDRFEKLEKENEDYFEKAKKLALERFQMERDVYEDLRGYEKDYYDAAARLIQEQAARYREAGVDEVAVAVWARQEMIKENIKKGKSAEDFVAGWKAGLEEMRRDAMTWGQAGYVTFKNFAERSQGTLSDVLFDGMKGQMKSFEDYWQSFADSMLRTLTDVVSRMIIEWLLLKSTMQMGSGLFGLMGGGSGMFFAKGGVFSGGRVTPFASGGVVDRPTLFPMASGAGVMGEKGPEAIMPLKRLPGGRLGVESAQPGGNLTISVPVTVAQKNNRMAAELRTEIEETVHKVIRRNS